MGDNLHSITEHSLALIADNPQVPEPYGLEQAAERLVEMEACQVIDIDEHAVTASLTRAGEVVLMPVLRELGMIGDPPVNAIAMIRWYRRAFDWAALVASGLPINEAKSQVAMDRLEEDIVWQEG